jgi:hypothetical protein
MEEAHAWLRAHGPTDEEAAALADLDADATPEVLEVIDEDLEAARLVVYGRP